MNTFQLSCFLAVANTLSFARAAEQMNISQPAITHQIKSLENELEVKLFNRSTRLVELTHEGQSFLSDAQSMVAIAAQAKLRFANPTDKPIEKLSIGCSSYNQLILLSDSLNELSMHYPNLHPHLIVVPYEQLYQQIENGVVDVVFDIQDNAERTSKMTFKELKKSTIVCVCRKDHPLATCEAVSIKELGSQPLIFCNPFNLVPEVSNLQWQLAEGKNPSDLHFCTSVEASIVMANAGFGLSVLPSLLVPAESDLATIKLKDAPQLSFGVFYKPYPGDDVLKTFIKIMQKNFAQSDNISENKDK